MEGAHGEIVVLSLPNSKLLGKVIKGIECVAGIKLSRVAQIFVSGVAHFFVVVGVSKIHERLAHFFIDIYIQKAERSFCCKSLRFAQTSKAEVRLYDDK